MSTLSHQLFTDENLNKILDDAVGLVRKRQEKITGVKPPQADLAAKYAETIKNLNHIRGRNLYYPYLSSGFGTGPYVELEDGSVKLDFINGIGINLFGHSHPTLLKTAIKASLQDVCMQGNLQPSKEYARLLELLLSAASKKSRLKKGWICTCGTIANENALKIVRQKNSPARKILAMKDNFAGRSTLMAAITDNPEYRMGLPVYDEVLYLPFYDEKDPASTDKAVNALRQHIAENPKNIACLITELVQGEGGFNTAPPSYFKALFEECRRNNIAIWADEIQTYSRTGELFAFEYLGLGEYIDIVTLAKTAQCGAVLYTEEYNPKPGLIAGTFTGSTVGMAVGHKSLEMLLEGINGEKVLGSGGRIEKIHKQFTAMLTRLKNGSCKGLISDIGGVGLMIAATPLDGSKEKVMKLLQVLFNHGIIAFSCGHGPYRIRFLLPLVLEESHVAEAQTIIEKSLLEVAQVK